MEFDARNVKTLIGLDDPIETMAKYKAPVEWRGQALLIISSNVLIHFPTDDGGLSSRMSLVRFPFTLMPRPSNGDEALEPGVRWQDPSVKLSLMEALVPEYFCWAQHFNKQLREQKQTGRLMTPRPPKIEAETDELFRKGSLMAAAGEEEAGLQQHLRSFEGLHLTEVPEDTNSQRGGTPATCGQVELKFAEYLRDRGVSAQMGDIKNLMRRIYLVALPSKPAVAFKVNRTSIRSFYRKVDHGLKKPFNTALMSKAAIAEQLAATSSAQ